MLNNIREVRKNKDVNIWKYMEIDKIREKVRELFKKNILRDYTLLETEDTTAEIDKIYSVGKKVIFENCVRFEKKWLIN